MGREICLGLTARNRQCGTTPLGLAGVRKHYPGWLVPRNPGLEDSAPLGLSDGANDQVSDFPLLKFGPPIGITNTPLINDQTIGCTPDVIPSPPIPTGLCPPAQGCPAAGLPWVNVPQHSQPQRGCVPSLIYAAYFSPLETTAPDPEKLSNLPLTPQHSGTHLPIPTGLCPPAVVKNSPPSPLDKEKRVVLY